MTLTLVVRRFLLSLFMLFLVSALVFGVLRVLPGNPIITHYGTTIANDPALMARVRRQLGLDQPIVVQYLHWLGSAVRGNLGQSYFNQYSVSTLFSQRLGPTAELMVVAVTVTIVLALCAGVASAVYRDSVVDRAILGFVSFFMAAPQFLVGIALILLISVQLKWLPTSGYASLMHNPLGNLRLVLLPAATLALSAFAPLTRFLRASLLEALEAPFIRTARGKGLKKWRIIFRHALPNALLPTLSMLGLIVGYMLGGVVVVEYVFEWPGLGSLAVNALLQRDYQVLQAVVLFVAAVFLAVNFVVDVLYGVIDPRLRSRMAEQ